jgi:hypothetical protein
VVEPAERGLDEPVPGQPVVLIGELDQHGDQAVVGEHQAALFIRAASVDPHVLHAQHHRLFYAA